MVFYLNLCFIVNVMPFTVSGQLFRTMFYISMHFCDFIVLCTVLLFRVYIVCPLSVLLPVLANKDVHISCVVVQYKTTLRPVDFEGKTIVNG